MPIAKLLFLSLLLMNSLFGSHAQTDITLGSTLTAGTNSTSWLSSSDDFAFGFYPVANGLFLLGIWFDKITDKTLIWSANRDTPAPAGSTVSLTATGQLTLTQPNGTSSQIYDGVDAKSASMQNDGNFVLNNSLSKVVWQSFDYPTDTIIPGQTLVLGQRLYSNKNGTVDFSTGRFRLDMQNLSSGRLLMEPFVYAERAYWWNTTILEPESKLVFNQSTAKMYVVNSTAITYSMTGTVPTPIEYYYHRATIEDTGNFQQYIYPKTGSGGWTSIWKAVEEPCFVNAVCGVYGYCTSPDNKTATCSCLDGYSLLDPYAPSKGCYPNVPPQQCAETPYPTEYTIQKIDDADFLNDPLADMSRFTHSDLESCEKALRDDCYSMAATLREGICLTKRIPFMNARKTSRTTSGYTAFYKVPSGSYDPPIEVAERNSRVPVILKVGLFIGIFFALASAIMALYYHPLARRFGLRKPPPSASANEINLRTFTFKELDEATNGFGKLIGRGNFGAVYSGFLSVGDKQIGIAVKKLKQVVEQGEKEEVMEQGEKEFLTEVKIIGQTHHKNLVRLLGFCNEQNHRLLVFELMKNGSVSGFLFGEGEKPNWDCRAELVIGIARGLLYLHEECETQIIHCDIKPQNVLLDNDYNAKISDFGISKLLMKDQTKTSTNARGTYGYMAPEWLKSCRITAKVDVYSFGVVLLEIICCRRHIELNRVEEETDEDDLHVTDWVLSCLRLGKLEMVVNHDPEILSDFKRFEKMAMVGLWCVHPDPLLRPTMKKVVQMLEGTTEIGVPPLANAESM